MQLEDVGQMVPCGVLPGTSSVKIRLFHLESPHQLDNLHVSTLLFNLQFLQCHVWGKEPFPDYIYREEESIFPLKTP